MSGPSAACAGQTATSAGQSTRESLLGPNAPLSRRDLKNVTRPSRPICPHSRSDRAQLLDCSLGSMVGGIYEKDDSTHIAERVLEHESLHLAIVRPTPMRSGEKGPTDFDLVRRLMVAVKTRRSDYPPGRGFRCKQSSPRVQRLLEKGVEASRLGTSLVGVLPTH
jgi:hypothetical protein